MLTIAKMQKILFEKDREKQSQMIEELSDADKAKLIAEAEKLAEDGRKLVEKYRMR